MASTRTVRAVQTGVTMSTPPPASRRAKSNFSEAEKQGLLQNFDLEVADKIQYFRSMLAQTLASFRMREETEILSIPRELRKMTLGDLEQKWESGWAGTLHRIKTERFQENEKVLEEKQEKEREEVVKGKRKRNGAATPLGSPGRAKNARKAPAEPTSARRPPTRATASSSARSGKASSSAKRPTRAATSASASGSKPASSLPQDHIFNPTLPPTPYGAGAHTSRSLASPLAHPSSRSQPPEAESDAESDAESHASSDSDDLPDPEALEARLLSKSVRSPPTNPSRKKRAPSLFFRQSLGGGALPPPATPGPAGDTDEPLATIELSDGRTISFNPFQLTPGRVEAELEEGGVSKEEKVRVQNQVHAEVVKSLQARMERWKV
ncbi:hypothetical protein IAT38_002776 [Cryptococcus sp. DSM 104549]